MHEHGRIPTGRFLDPSVRVRPAAPEAFMLLHSPLHQSEIEVLKKSPQRRPIEGFVVIDPSLYFRIAHPGQIL